MTAERGAGSGRIAGLLRQLFVTYAAGAACGAAAFALGLPLPWMLGPFFVFAALSSAGLRFRLVPKGRELAQVAIGLAIGLRFTAPVVGALLLLLPQMALATVYLIAVTTTAAFLFRRLGGVDPVTAFFATAAGGVADMAIVAERFGGVPSSVAVVHAMRVSLVVATAPFIVLGAMQGAGGSSFGAPGSIEGLPLLVGGLAAAYAVAVLLKPTPLPNPWLVGPILAGMAMALAGLQGIVVPGWLIMVAQVVLGVWLGCQFRRDLLTALPRVTAAAVAIGFFLIGMAAVGAVGLSHLGDMPFSTAFLSLAPAAVTEMVLIAKVMHLDAETVAAFHVMRIVIVATTVLGVFKLYCALGRIRLGS
ncbi:AbrB family transcriptional regulator [Aliigemmobacter aestuarii]|uniref:AbrB family transcriptional regulator n=1 Tax=Aliigemmobacter aestuarii TaxID=1445661 RepID=A0A4S3MQA1_9RHOB|nr:AbrB family transcriptional regulator [Gemmobacter aestuarii]THD84686.1 AbrB family transcriptional regulator [Gemmobacter aestuarii]